MNEKTVSRNIPSFVLRRSLFDVSFFRLFDSIFARSPTAACIHKGNIYIHRRHTHARTSHMHMEAQTTPNEKESTSSNAVRYACVCGNDGCFIRRRRHRRSVVQQRSWDFVGQKVLNGQPEPISKFTVIGFPVFFSFLSLVSPKKTIYINNRVSTLPTNTLKVKLYEFI